MHPFACKSASNPSQLVFSLVWGGRRLAPDGTSGARPKRTIGDNHDLWQEIRFEKSPLREETYVGAQSGGAQRTRTKPGNGTPGGIASGAGSCPEGRMGRAQSSPVLTTAPACFQHAGAVA
jgi:hypothetical protein